MKKPLFTLVIFAIILSSSVANAKTYTESWSDLNYVPCEGVGIHGSGKVELTSDIIDEGDYYKITAFNIAISHPLGRNPAGKISVTDWKNKKISILLVKPWFNIISEPGKQWINMPKKANGSHSAEQQEIKVKKDSPIEIQVNVQFSHDSGFCSSNFNKTWTIPRN
ncbi:hypothetical protein [Thiothrix sp.]|jgi:hypothetical protein|uniref:hypothetical protein n=1 Tax=Thiothrix sp. TaxID=1032 RepID=UPI00257A91D9|nr:hypothetical protein [Thiothrix sp.]